MRKVTLTSLAILLVLVLLGFLFVSTNAKAKIMNSERFYVEGGVSPMSAGVPEAPRQPSVAAGAPANPDAASSGIGALGASDPSGNEVFNPVEGSPAPVAGNCFPRDRLSAEDLLPKDAANSKWSQMNPAGQGDVRDKNFLTAGWHIGVDSVGASKKIANLDIRSAPPNPRVAVSPWNISTVEWSDANRKPLEIGGDY